jgi:hypothetical protein
MRGARVKKRKNGESCSLINEKRFEIAFSLWRTGHTIRRTEQGGGVVWVGMYDSLAVFRPVDWVQGEHIYTSVFVRQRVAVNG